MAIPHFESGERPQLSVREFLLLTPEKAGLTRLPRPTDFEDDPVIARLKVTTGQFRVGQADATHGPYRDGTKKHIVAYHETPYATIISRVISRAYQGHEEWDREIVATNVMLPQVEETFRSIPQAAQVKALGEARAMATSVQDTVLIKSLRAFEAAAEDQWGPTKSEHIRRAGEFSTAVALQLSFNRPAALPANEQSRP